MISKIFFAIAFILIVCWVILFMIFNTFLYLHVIGIIAIILFFASYTTHDAEN